jgi:hypothetical protein
MAEVINLRRKRKGRIRQLAAAEAAERRARFGRPVAQRKLEQALQSRRIRILDGHRIEPEGKR